MTLRVYQVTGPRPYKDGSVRVETWVDAWDDCPRENNDRDKYDRNRFKVVPLAEMPGEHSQVIAFGYRPVPFPDRQTPMVEKPATRIVRIDEAAIAAADEEARLARMTRAERLVEAETRAAARFEERIAALEARVAALEGGEA